MKAAVIHEYGSPEVLKYEDFPDPRLAHGEVLIRVAAAGVNPIDLHEREGATKEWRPVKFPGVLGWDLAGTVVGLGDGVNGFAMGERVFGWAYHTYAELCAVKTELLAKTPERLDLFQAAALPLVSATGCQLITLASGLTAGQSVLVSGAVGSVGRAAIFAAKDKGAKVFAGVRSRDRAIAETLGVDGIVALDDPEELARLAPVDVVANCIPGAAASQLLGKVKPGGMFASVTGVPDGADAFPQVRTKAFVSKQDVATYLYAAEGIISGKLQIPVSRVFPLRQAADAHAHMARGGAGKILLRP